jgi:hypothetical protein
MNPPGWSWSWSWSRCDNPVRVQRTVRAVRNKKVARDSLFIDSDPGSVQLNGEVLHRSVQRLSVIKWNRIKIRLQKSLPRKKKGVDRKKWSPISVSRSWYRHIIRLEGAAAASVLCSAARTAWDGGIAGTVGSLAECGVNPEA